MNVPTIPRFLLKFGIKPQKTGTERLFSVSRHGTHLAGFDVETIGTSLFRKNDLYSVQIVIDKPHNSHIFFPKTQGIKNLDLFFEVCDSHTRKIFASAHNASFDIGALLGSDIYPLMMGEEVGGWKGKVVDGNCCFLMLRNQRNQWLVVTDSMAWFKGSLKNVAAKYCNAALQKNKRPDFLGLRAPKTIREFNKFVDYAEQDAQIQLELTKKIHSYADEGGVKLCLTPAQLAGKVFQKRYLKNRVFLPNPKLLPLIVRSYHGAQFTAFGRGFFKDVFYYDINSLYPYAAMNAPLNFSNTELEPMSIEDAENGYTGFIGVKFKFNEDEQYPCLPQYREIGTTKKMVFPRTGVSFCTTEELGPAFKKGVEILGWKGYGWYPEQEDITHPLADFMRDIYEKKKNLDSLAEPDAAQRDLRQYYKLLLNSLIGKFCQRNKTWPAGREIAGGLFMPDFGSLILSKSRAIINKLISKHGAIYSDTDCLMTKHSLPTGKEIGELKNELGEGNKGDLLAIRSKLYFVTKEDKLLKCAKHGFRKPSKEVFASLLDARHKSFVEYSVRRLTRLKEAYRRHRLPRREVSQTFKIMLRDDGKRKYEESLETVEELLNGSTGSMPLGGWI